MPGVLIATTFVAAVAASGAAAASPQRIASMNLCTDQMALMLVGPARMASISFLGADPAESALAEDAKGIPINHGLAEEIIAAKPDLVLTGRYTTGFAKTLLRRLGYPVIEVDSPNTIDGIRDVFMTVGEAVGEADRARGLLADMDRRLQAVTAPHSAGPRRSAIIYDANGFTVGHPGLADDVMRLVGLANKATELGIGAYGQIPIESMLAAKPDMIIHLIYRPGVPSIASAAMNHPAVRAALGGRHSIDIPGRLLTCGTPVLAAAAEKLAAAVAENDP